MSKENQIRRISGRGQIRGPLQHKDSAENPINLIGLFDTSFRGYISKLSIQAPEDSVVYLNNKKFVIGKTGFLEFESGLKITSLAFDTEITKDVSIDFVYIQ